MFTAAAAKLVLFGACVRDVRYYISENHNDGIQCICQ